MTPAVSIVLLWIGFAGSHMLLSHVPIRDRLVARLGAKPFQGLYSLVALGFFVPLVRIYFRHVHEGPALWTLPHGPVLTWIVQIGMGVAFVLLVAGFAKPSPASMAPGPATVRGALRITRHPVIMSMGLFGLLHLLVNGTTTDVAFFAGFPIFAVAGCWHQDRRKLAKQQPGYAEFVARTPFLPFTGGNVVAAVREIGLVPFAAGIALAAIVRWGHGLWGGA